MLLNLAHDVGVLKDGFAGAAMLAEYSALLMSGLSLHQECRPSFANLQRVAFTL